MQFEPSTWALYGDGGDIMNPDDAIPAAARLLVASGAPGNLQQAIFAYNHSGSYVQLVLSWAARYSAGGAQAISAAGSAVCQQAALGTLPPAPPGRSSQGLRRQGEVQLSLDEQVCLMMLLKEGRGEVPSRGKRLHAEGGTVRRVRAPVREVHKPGSARLGRSLPARLGAPDHVRPIRDIGPSPGPPVKSAAWMRGSKRIPGSPDR